MHVIRLRENWFLSSPHGPVHSSGANAGSEPLLVGEPAQWLSQRGPDTAESGSRRRVRLARRFHSPTGIASNDVVAVAFEHRGVAGRVLLDGELLADFDSAGAKQPIRFSHDIRAKLQQSHELTIEIDLSEHAQPVFGVVRLEIHSV